MCNSDYWNRIAKARELDQYRRYGKYIEQLEEEEKKAKAWADRNKKERKDREAYRNRFYGS